MVLLMHRASFFIVTAVGEASVGLALLVRPSLPLTLLLGVSELPPEGLLVARLAGAALLALGVASWLARSAAENSARRGLLVGLLIYDAIAAVLLGYAGLILSLVGIALWPAVVLHALLAIWCGLCLLVKSHGDFPKVHSDPSRDP